MKKLKKKQDQLSRKRHKKELRRKRKKYITIPLFPESREVDIEKIKNGFFSDNLKYISKNINTPLLGNKNDSSSKIFIEKTFLVPKKLSLVEKPKETYSFIENVINCIYENRVQNIILDYSACETIHLGAQVYLDVLLKYVLKAIKNFGNSYFKHNILQRVRAINTKSVDKLLNSIGSFAVLRNRTKQYKDIIPYRLCDFKINPDATKLFNIEKKEVHVTEMVSYVIKSLGRMGKNLTPEKIESLATIIGEVLINAEEHSSYNHRFSIGYFQEFNEDKDQFGIFNLAILNLGRTIYDTFKDENCERPEIVNQMKELSKKYERQKLFNSNLKEETLWTLYALQEEVTSVSSERHKKRGNGSIRFIESFFNIKGEGNKADNFSRLAILSGNTSIVFDGKYGIKEKRKNEETFRVMTFNESNDISQKPNSKYVKFVKNHFPGTIISAQILINKDDVK